MTTLNLHPIGPTAFDTLYAKLKEAERRAVRTETRLMRLMDHVGMATDGLRPIVRETYNTPHKEAA